jgi:hypothetical protein
MSISFCIFEALIKNHTKIHYEKNQTKVICLLYQVGVDTIDFINGHVNYVK